ncbi:hypothetical protein CO662_03135 [Rhizobium anhuiense]|uniref:Lipoprotein n=1 Tax=Rhizobium anhuiense TaxID=1184720 RepID=A0A3S0XQX2_9HYPH|nr:hypothetical protein [Rhizobium anhuiense]MBB3297109.1 hypothetical protein [Rhizobium sp. BK112]MBB3366324.1 hypothetical protein [Rhizobium sp. BK077]MBB3741301.1 hypothetical protein [Rhizobium sp. BK591]MBB4110991.1 hypothetical protein [Rhizobium sp. BK226]MBB4177002.1 hypothetical protein [Rhizobium sp. BK109]MBB4250009.1 hypothetical protein [Rhizobium sp. BK008]
MKSIFAYSILAAAVISLSSCTTTSDSFRRESASLTVRSGERTRAGQVWRIHSDCSLADYPPTHIIEQPKHGRLQIVHEPIFPHEAKGKLAKCRTVKVGGVAGYYTSKPGYIGSDRFVVRFPVGDGEIKEMVLNVSVMQ